MQCLFEQAVADRAAISSIALEPNEPNLFGISRREPPPLPLVIALPLIIGLSIGMWALIGWLVSAFVIC